MQDTQVTPRIIDGRKLSVDIREELREEVEKHVSKGWRAPHLVAILVGEDPASHTYVRNKVIACEKCGIRSTELKYDADLSEIDLLQKLDALNNDPNVDGILVQLPLPDHISKDKVIETIAPNKDVDGFHPINIGRMAKNLPCPLPATPGGIMEMLLRYKIPTRGKHCVVVGRSNIVGSPISILMARPGDATVTITHRHTANLGHYTRQADILIVAVGKTDLITPEMVKEGAVIIDVGINRVPDETKKSGFRLTGDVPHEVSRQKASFFTPVPGGVGPMTIAILLKNTIWAWQNHVEIPIEERGINTDFFNAFNQFHHEV